MSSSEEFDGDNIGEVDVEVDVGYDDDDFDGGYDSDDITEGSGFMSAMGLSPKQKAHAKAATSVVKNAAGAAVQGVATSVEDRAVAGIQGRYDGAYEGIAAGYYGAGVSGGGSGISAPNGGLQETKDLTDYAESIYSITKDNLVDDIADALRKLGLKVEGSNRSEVINSMLKAVPNTRTNKRTFKADARTHKDICRKVALVLNSKFGEKLIDPAAAPEQICQATAELMYSLHSGMHSEFLAIQGDVNRTIRNLAILKQTLAENMSTLESKLGGIKDKKATLKVAKNVSLHKDVLVEVDRQLRLLQNLMSVTIDPADARIESLVRQGKDIDILGLIQPLKNTRADVARPGSKEFSRVMGRVLTGVALTPSYAEVINTALKMAGMSMKEYAGMDRMGELMDRISTEISKDRSDESLHELIQAMELLVKNFYRNKDIANLLSKSGSVEVAGSSEMSVSGGVGSTMSKRIKDTQTTRDVLFYAFGKQTNVAFDRILASVEVLAKKLGTADVPMSDQLAGFRDAFAGLSDMRRRRVYFALTGYYNDAISKEMRERFMGKLRMVLSYAESLSEMSSYSSVSGQFKDIKSAVDALIKTLDEYSDKIGAKFGSAEAAADEGGAVTGGAKLKNTLAKGVDAHKSTLTIQRAIKMFDYYFRVAEIRRNLREASVDMDKYGEDYKELLASAMGGKIQEIVDAHEKELKDLNDDKLNPYLNNGEKNTHTMHQGAVGHVHHTPALRLAMKKDITEFLKAQHGAKIKFWETVEAADQYLKEFTNGMMKHPDDVKDIKNTLDGVQVISNWYDDRSGNELGLLFEQFPGRVVDHNDDNYTRLSPYQKNVEKNMGKHYYEAVLSVHDGLGGGPAPAAQDILPGNPFLVQVPTQQKAILAQASKVIANMALLKNLMSVFVTIGDRLGNEDMHKKTFMSPSQMYENLCNFIAASSFGHELGAAVPAVGAVAAAGTIYHPHMTLNTWQTVPAGDANLSHVVPAVGVYDIDNVVADATITLGVSTHDRVANLGAVDHTDIQRRGAYRNALGDWGIYMSAIDGAYDNNPLDIFKGNFTEENQMFANLMKALSAKVLTVLGTYDLMERPNEKQLINPVRMILGGATDTPEILEGAVELYTRLPLLAEFYRELFDFKGTDYKIDGVGADSTNGDAIKITMLPEMQGKFAQVVRLLFRRFAHVKKQQYTDSELAELITEINALYNSFRGASDISHSVLRGFIDEVNKRYGILKYKNHVAYLKSIESQDVYGRAAEGDLRTRAYEDNTDNYSILPGEDDFETERIAPSSSYVTKGKIDITSSAGVKNALTKHHALMRTFRCKVDGYFEKGFGDPAVCPRDDEDTDYNDPENARTAGFRFAIKRTQMQLAAIKEKKERYDVVSRLMRGYNATSTSDHVKFATFHETVISGLNSLSGIYAILERFQREILLHDVADVEKLLRIIFRNVDGEFGDLNNIAYEAAQMDHAMVLRKVSLYLTDKYKPRFGTDAALYDLAADRILRDAAPAVIRSGLTVAPGDVHAPGAAEKGWGAAAGGGILDVLGYGQAGHAPQNNPPSDNQVNVAIRYIIKREKLMKRLLETIFGISDDLQGLVTVDIGDSIQINFSKARELVEGLIGDVKHYIEKMRPFIPAETMYEYERKENPGSIYWLEEHLMEKMFIGREPISERVLDDGDNLDASSGYVSLNDTVRVLNNSYQRLTCNWKVDGTTLNVVGGGASVINTVNVIETDHYDQEVCQIAYYNTTYASATTQFIDNAAAGVTQPMHAGGPGENSILEHVRHRNGDIWRSDINEGNNLNFVTNLHNNGAAIDMLDADEPNSIFFSFNRILENYLASFYDNVSNRIYRGTIENLANGVLNASVANTAGAWPDFVQGPYQDPKPTSVLFASLSAVLKNLIGHKDRSEKKLLYVEESLSEISQYMKEKYRAHMPIYKTYLMDLIRKAELLRKLTLQKVGSNYKLALVRDVVPVGAGGGAGLAAEATAAERVKTFAQYASVNEHVAAVLASVVEASMGLIGCIDQVMRELGDEPKYMETRLNAFADYKSQYNANPLTPLSSMLEVMKHEPTLLQLTQSQGPQFKFQYGVRGVLARLDSEIQPEHIPYAMDLFEMHNTLLGPKEQLDMSRNRAFAGRLISAARWIHEVKNIKSKFNVHKCDKMLPNARSLVDIDITGYAPAAPPAVIAGQIVLDNHTANNAHETRLVPSVDRTYHGAFRIVSTISTHADNKLRASQGIKQTVSVLVDFTENSLRKAKIEDLGNYVLNSTRKYNLVMQNILDMNVIPINVHAFMREVPLANIMNYSYTFERMIIELFYGLNEPEIRTEMLNALCQNGKIDKTHIRNPKDLFVAMLIDPYLEVNHSGLYELMRQLFRGDSSMELDRPKYLADQMFNKALFDQLYGQDDWGNKMGPHAQGVDGANVEGRWRQDEMPRPKPIDNAITAAVALPAVAHPAAVAAVDDATRSGPDPTLRAQGADATHLTYLPAYKKQSRGNYEAIQDVDVANVVEMLRATGKLRFDTVLIRNLIFLVNLYRVIRLKLRKDLMYDRNIILKSHSAAREDTTEHTRNDRWTERDYAPELVGKYGTRPHQRM